MAVKDTREADKIARKFTVEEARETDEAAWRLTVK